MRMDNLLQDQISKLIPGCYPEWKRPESKAMGYMYGDVVTYKGIDYVSVCNCNRWEPGHCGWELFV